MKSIRTILALMLLALSPAARAASCQADEFRVMTYNIRLDTEADGPNRWANRRALFTGQVRLLRPDILGMQEVLPGQRADLVADLPGYLALGGGRDDGKLAGEASPLFVARSRFAVLGSGMFWLSSTPHVPSLGWDASYRRVATWAHLRRRSDGMRLLAINTHWDHLGKQARLNSALQLRGWIAANRRPGEAVVLLGDFNAPLTEASLQALLSPPMLVDSRALSQEPAIGATITFNGWTPIPTSGDTIDHVLVGSGLAVKRYHALAEHFDGRLASDHFPVIADLAPTACAARPRA
jgi:endonuclease/exonuclease/phosphatase family metal-dependent hydrolase